MVADVQEVNEKWEFIAVFMCIQKSMMTLMHLTVIIVLLNAGKLDTALKRKSNIFFQNLK